MPKAVSALTTTSQAPTRRNLLAGSAAASVAIAAQAGAHHAPHFDDQLIAVCAEFDTLDHETSIIHGTGPNCVVDDDEADAASAPLFERMQDLLGRMEKLHAATTAGIHARAHSLALHGDHGGYDFGARGTMVGDMLAYLLRDARALGAAA